MERYLWLSLSVHDTEIGEGTNERSELRAMHFAIYGLGMASIRR